MTDFYFTAEVLRDQVADQLSQNTEQAPYVLARVASMIAPGTMDFDDFCDNLETVDEDDKARLKIFCQRIVDRLSD